ncbi:type II secretion system protein [candidate division WWE3 bacterium]|uniref:Type II secretion system protein n=1 Tax=candidate division WWE3 bacterium TaxID=2053526 RepID=A0A7X9HH87_UNCKA|nr:type II secretion system protein [candidate division WWE3 bacterium]
MLNKKGFTLVELLIVIIVMSILSGVVISVVNVSGMRARGRDSQRKSDISKIASALELYYTDNRSYPISANWINAGISTSVLATNLVPNYIDVIPNDPNYIVDVATPCSRNGGGSADFDYRYNYRTSSTGSRYLLTALMENASSDDESKCASLVNWTSATCGGGAVVCGCTAGDSYTGALDYCYGIENPF